MLQKIGKYEIFEQIGVGGFGAVYKGRDPFIKRTVAIKTCQVNDDEIKRRFGDHADRICAYFPGSTHPAEVIGRLASALKS